MLMKNLSEFTEIYIGKLGEQAREKWFNFIGNFGSINSFFWGKLSNLFWRGDEDPETTEVVTTNGGRND
ncbi:hypothetical protein [Laspinema palackyanum]|uniref:hypothetical protein n=1 Tax=Laspinema palackyanum TaxID=3231601 RepID=UPI00345D88C8|nr:hypothetical protein [Laspinema sp. D2c]